MAGVLTLLAGMGAALPKLESSSYYADGTNVAVPSKPAGTVSGDLLVALIYADGATTVTLPAGWAGQFNGAGDAFLQIAIKDAGGSEPSSYTFTNADAGRKTGVRVLRFSDAAFDVAGTEDVGNGNGTRTAPQITAAGGLLLMSCCAQRSPRTFSTPAGMALIGNEEAIMPNNASFIETITAGATGTRSTTTAGGLGPRSVVLCSIKSK